MFGTTNTVYCKYIVSKVDIMIPGKDTISVSHNNIGGIIIEKDFDADIHPVMEIKLALKPLEIYDILDNKNTVRFNIRVDKYVYKNSDASSYIYKDLSFNEVFAIYIDDNSAQLDKDLYLQNANITKTNTNISDINEVYSFFIFKPNDIDASRSMVNAILSNVDMTDTVSYLLSTSGCKNVLMTPIENTVVYDEVILYPVTTLSNIGKLNKEYGFYKNGLTVFFDITRTYFIDKRGNTTVYARQEYTDVMVYVYKSSNSNTMSGGYEKNNKTRTYYMNIVVSSINMKANGPILNEISGIDKYIVDSMNDEVIEVSPDIEHRGKRVSTIVDKNNVFNGTNEYIANELDARIREQNSIFEASFTGIDIDIFTPNKRFTFVFEDSEIHKRVGGTYRIAKIISTMAPKGQSLVATASCVFYRID